MAFRFASPLTDFPTAVGGAQHTELTGAELHIQARLDRARKQRRPSASSSSRYHAHATARQVYECVRDESSMCVMLVKSDTCPYSQATMKAAAQLERSQHAKEVPSHNMVVVNVPQVRDAIQLAKDAGDSRITDILQHVYSNSKYVPVLVRLPAHRSVGTRLNAVVGSRDVDGLVQFIKHNK